MSELVMLDLFSGLGGASQAMRDRGWKVFGVEYLERLKPTIVADVRFLPLTPFPVDLLWASPPCEQYSAKYQFCGWLPNAPDPDLSPWQATLDIIEAWHPKFYCIENVWGATRVWGKATYHFGSRYLWTDLPLLGQCPPIVKAGALHHDSRKWRLAHYGPEAKYVPATYHSKSKIEYHLSEIIASAVEVFS